VILDLLLDPVAFNAGLAALALGLPLAAWALWRARPAWRRRWLLACGAAGPWALALWGIHNAVLASLGFASIAGALVMLALGAGSGLAAGLWIRRDPAAPA
jgi:hypothetical protein